MLADMKYIPLSRESRTDTVRRIQRIKLVLNDYLFNVGDLLKDLETGFESAVTHTRIIPYDNRF